MQIGEVYYKFAIYKNKPFLKTFTVKEPSKQTKNSYLYEESYSISSSLHVLRERDKNHIFFENEIGAATNIYEQYKLRTQQGVSSPMITRIVEWDYFQKLLEDYPGIMV